MAGGTLRFARLGGNKSLPGNVEENTNQAKLFSRQLDVEIMDVLYYGREFVEGMALWEVVCGQLKPIVRPCVRLSFANSAHATFGHTISRIK